MKLTALVPALVAWAGAVLATSNNLTDLVTWDQYSLLVNNSRVFINSAEFHYQRLPVPALWLDVFQKLKANGFNTVSLYFFWSYHSPNKDVYDFDSPGKNVQQLLDYAKEAGLWVIARPGPYCNAETSGGGLALWGSDGSLGKLRTADETYHQAWLPWVQKIGKIIADNQITKGGPVILTQIENEYQENNYSPDATEVRHMEQIETAFRDAGIVVPFTHNEKGMRSVSWSTDYKNVGGAVDIYGLDSYPGGLSCTNVNSGFNVVRTYHQWFSNYSYTQPSYVPEFQAGWFSAWGDVFYDECASLHDPAFADVYYKNNIGQRITMQSLYMAYGGTNWGHSAAPVVYTSYDYNSPLRETRQQWNTLFQTKLVNMFSNSSPELLKTVMVGNGTGFRASASSVFTWVLKNPDTGATFTVLQQATTPSRANITVSATLDTSAGMITVPDVSLTGRESKILVTDYAFGKHALLYSTADVLTWGSFDDASVLVLYLTVGQTGRFVLRNDDGASYTTTGPSQVQSDTTNGTTRGFTYTQAAGTTAVRFSNGIVLYLLDRSTAWRFWSPATIVTPRPAADAKLFVLGPYLVRSAYISHEVLHVSGDNDQETLLEAYVGSSPIETIVWNGLRLQVSKTAYGAYTATIPGTKDRAIKLPKLEKWKSADTLPELKPEYDDSKWTICNKTTTLSPVAPLTLPVLFSSDYGYYVGPKVYRGYFDGANATAVNLTCSGGLAFGWTAWLNGVLIGGHNGNATLTTTDASLALPSTAVRSTNNVLTVLVDYHGHDQTSTAKGVENPRGILGATLAPYGTRNATGFSTWKIQGNAGGGAYLDPVRGPMNEGGLYAERLGWFLPGFDPKTSSQAAAFDTSSPLTGLSTSGARFYTTSFRLDLDSDLDVPVGVELSAPPGTVARVMLWVNGYQYGKYVPHIGPQTRFPIPPGVLNNRGENTLAISIWAQTAAGAQLNKVELFSYGAYQSDFGFNRDWSALQPRWVNNREQYA